MKNASPDSYRQPPLTAFGSGRTGVENDTVTHTYDRERVSIYASPDPLLDVAGWAARPTELVIAPTQHHQRTIKRRCAATNAPHERFALRDPATVASTLLESAPDGDASRLDRVDRIRLLEDDLSLPDDAAAALTRVIGTAPSASADAVDRHRRAVERTTSYHPDRLAGLQGWVNARDRPYTTTVDDARIAALAVERWLRTRTDKPPSEGALLRRAARRLCADGPRRMTRAYPSVERVWVAGTSSLSAPLADLLAATLRSTDLDLRLCLQPVAAETVGARLCESVDIDGPGTDIFREDADA